MSLQSKIIFQIILGILVLSSKALGEEENVKLVDDSLINYTEATIFGLVEGVTEFLPISSTGHLILAKDWMLTPSKLSVAEQDAVNAYLIVIQAGAIFAVALLYARRIVTILLGFMGLDPKGKKLGLNLLAAFTPAAVLGPFLDEWIEAILFGAIPVAIALVLGAMLMHWAEKRKRQLDGIGGYEGKTVEELTLKNALFIGVLQCVAMCPGTSRSMMTIVGGYFAGLSRRHSAEFSFLLGLITLTAAAGYKALTKGGELVQYLKAGPMLFGCLIAGISAALSVRWLVGYLGRHGLTLFVWYRLCLGLIILFYSQIF